MCLKTVLLISTITFLCKATTLSQEGSSCANGAQLGVCTRIPKCLKVLRDVQLHSHHNFTRCGFAGLDEVVCCPILRKSAKACAKYYPESGSRGRRELIIAGGRNTKYVKYVNGRRYVVWDADADEDRSEDEPQQKTHEFPFIAALGLYSQKQRLYKFSCGSTIVSDKYLITAAHCISNIANEEPRIVRTGKRDVPGTTSEPKPGFDYEIRNCIVHPNYNPRLKSNDIALIELNTLLKLGSTEQIACLLDGTDYPEELTIVGWGATENAERSEVLQAANVSLVSKEECNQRYRKYNKTLESTQLCAYNNQSDTCEGDSGGPLVKRDSDHPVLVGVTSFGDIGCSGGKLSVYSSVSQYLDWIEDIVWSDDLKPADLDEFPFVVALGGLGCGGTIISQTHIVTAAHCVTHLLPDFIKVGVTKFSTMSSFDTKIKNIIIHPNYTGILHDIALLELETPLEFGSNLQKVRFASGGSLDTNKKLTVACWLEEEIDAKNFLFEKVLKKTRVLLEPFDKCRRRYFDVLKDTQLCATHHKADVCKENFGGPLMAYDSEGPVLIGVSSFGRPGCFTGGTYVYTSVGKYSDWLNKIISKT